MGIFKKELSYCGAWKSYKGNPIRSMSVDTNKGIVTIETIDYIKKKRRFVFTFTKFLETGIGFGLTPCKENRCEVFSTGKYLLMNHVSI